MASNKTEAIQKYITAEALRRLLIGVEEHAVIDVREEGRFDKGHLFWANNIPLSQLELLLDARIPRRSVAIVLIDENDGLAERAAAKLAVFGYSNAVILRDGVHAWEKAGFPLYQGINVPSKAFGEFVEHTYGTPHISASELKALTDAKADVVILDSRPLPEFQARSIPGGIDCPGAELPYRVHDLVQSPSTFIVVNCAGRTRSIIGAQSLINAGVPNRVAALKDGTMGWHLSGYKVASGETAFAAAPTQQGLNKAQASAKLLAGRFGVRSITESELQRFEAESDTRSVYLFDVRQPEEYLAGHRRGARHAQGGQLVQATDTYVGVRNSRIVLTDDDGVRATATATWLIQIGWPEVYVLSGGLGTENIVRGSEKQTVLGLDETSVRFVEPSEVRELLTNGNGAVVDLQPSDAYGTAHIPGAWFAIRSRLQTSLPKLPFDEFVLTSPDGVLAALAAQDLKRTLATSIKVLSGGTEAWRAAGLPVEQGMTNLADEPDDVVVKAANRKTNAEAAMREYLQWETDLVRQIASDADVAFRKFSVAAQATPA